MVPTFSIHYRATCLNSLIVNSVRPFIHRVLFYDFFLLKKRFKTGLIQMVFLTFTSSKEDIIFSLPEVSTMLSRKLNSLPVSFCSTIFINVPKQLVTRAL